MNAVFAIARADLLERTRTFGMLIIIAGLLELGYLFVPDRSALYSTIDLGGWRGRYDSAWMGASTALLSASLLPLLGFFLIRPAQSRDAVLRTYDLIVCAPLPRPFVVLGKWTSNVVLLVGFAALLALAAVAMQFVRAEDRTLDLAAYIVPFVVVTVPACAITASLALVVAALPGLRGIGGGVIWFFLWSALIAVPMQIAGIRAIAFDPLGVTILSSALFHGLASAVPQANVGSDLSVGLSDPAKHVFRFAGIAWNSASVAVRAAWVASAVFITFIASPFTLLAGAKPSRGRFAELPGRLVRSLPLPPLVRAELSMAFGEAGPLWLVGAGILTVAALVVPGEALARAVAPFVWVWPIGPIANATIMDSRAGLSDVLLATPTPAWRRVAARIAGCFVLAGVPVTALAIHSGGAGIALPALAFAAAAVAVLLGAATGSALPFEGVALLLWYVGVVNRLPLLDPARSTTAPAAVVLICVAVSGLAMLLSAKIIARRT